MHQCVLEVQTPNFFGFCGKNACAISPKTTNFESENKSVFELIEIYAFVIKHIVISKNVSDNAFDRLLTNNQCHQAQRLFSN